MQSRAQTLPESRLRQPYVWQSNAARLVRAVCIVAPCLRIREFRPIKLLQQTYHLLLFARLASSFVSARDEKTTRSVVAFRRANKTDERARLAEIKVLCRSSR